MNIDLFIRIFEIRIFFKGALFGGVMGGIAMRYGRRKVLLVMSLPFSLSWILTVFATSVEMMFFTSFMGGFCCSIVSMVSQVKYFIFKNIIQQYTTKTCIRVRLCFRCPKKSESNVNYPENIY